MLKPAHRKQVIIAAGVLIAASWFLPWVTSDLSGTDAALIQATQKAMGEAGGLPGGNLFSISFLGIAVAIASSIYAAIGLLLAIGQATRKKACVAFVLALWLGGGATMILFKSGMISATSKVVASGVTLTTGPGIGVWVLLLALAATPVLSVLAIVRPDAAGVKN